MSTSSRFSYEINLLIDHINQFITQIIQFYHKTISKFKKFLYIFDQYNFIIEVQFNLLILPKIKKILNRIKLLSPNDKKNDIA